MPASIAEWPGAASARERGLVLPPGLALRAPPTAIVRVVEIEHVIGREALGVVERHGIVGALSLQEADELGGGPDIGPMGLVYCHVAQPSVSENGPTRLEEPQLASIDASPARFEDRLPPGR
jgi:hypothetical protein